MYPHSGKQQDHATSCFYSPERKKIFICNKMQQGTAANIILNVVVVVVGNYISLTCVIPPNPLTDVYSRKRSRGLRPTAGRFVKPMAFSSMKAK